MNYNLLPLTTACIGLIHSIAIDNGSVWLMHSVVKGNRVYEAVVSTLSGCTLWAVPLFSKASMVQMLM